MIRVLVEFSVLLFLTVFAAYWFKMGQRSKHQRGDWEQVSRGEKKQIKLAFRQRQKNAERHAKDLRYLAKLNTAKLEHDLDFLPHLDPEVKAMCPHQDCRKARPILRGDRGAPPLFIRSKDPMRATDVQTLFADNQPIMILPAEMEIIPLPQEGGPLKP